MRKLAARTALRRCSGQPRAKSRGGGRRARPAREARRRYLAETRVVKSRVPRPAESRSAGGNVAAALAARRGADPERVQVRAVEHELEPYGGVRETADRRATRPAHGVFRAVAGNWNRPVCFKAR